MPLPLGLGAGADDARSSGVNANLGAVEHLDAENVEVLRRPGADDLGEGGEADSHQLALRSFLGLLLQKRLIADLLERHVERAVVVTAVVGEPECRGIRELILPHEVLAPEFHRIHAELVGEDVHAALDRVAGLGDAERAAIGDAARRLVREVGVDLGVRDREGVAAGDHAEHAGRVFRGVGGGVEGAVIGSGRHAQGGHRAVGPGADLHVHVVVAREPGARQVLGSRLDPLHRPPELQRADDGADVPGIHRHLVAEAAADVRRDDSDLVLGDAGDDGDGSSIDVGRLRGHVEREPSHRVELGDTAARLEWRRVAARKPDPLFDDFVRGGKRLCRLVLVADLPVVDVIGLRLTIGAEQHLVLLRNEGIGDDRQRLVLHLHRLGAVSGGSARLRKHRRHFLVLEQHLADCQDHLLVVAVERRQPAEPGRLEILAGDDGFHAGHRQRGRAVDIDDLRVRVGAAHDRHVQHAGEAQVVDVIALALEEARILLALHRHAQRALGGCFDAHDASPFGPTSGPAPPAASPLPGAPP